MSDDAEHEQARETAEERATAAAQTARAEAKWLEAESTAPTGPMAQEVLGQRGLIYGGLILIGLYMVQPYLTAPSLDASAKVSIVAFSVAIPLLAALVMVNRQETFAAAEPRPSPSCSPT